MDKFTIDFTNFKESPIICDTWDSFYEVIIRDLSLPDWCGRNPDAIWDMLTGYINLPVSICIKGIHKLPENFDHQAKTIIEIFTRACAFNQSLMFVEYVD